jgi:hypothetical protein
MKSTFAFLFICFFQTIAHGQSFVPTEYEYPKDILAAPSVYIYKKSGESALRIREIKRMDKDGSVHISWKEYDDNNPSQSDSCNEINNKISDHYLINGNRRFKETVVEDSIYKDGTKLGTKIQRGYFIFPFDTISLSIRSAYLKDSTLSWQNRSVPVLVISSVAKTYYTDDADRSKTRESNVQVLYYFGKGVGLMRFSTTEDGVVKEWELQEIKQVQEP